MEQIPKLKVGARVRVMQTDEMVEKGLANKRGKVIEILPGSSYGDACVVRLDDMEEPKLFYSYSLFEVSDGKTE